MTTEKFQKLNEAYQKLNYSIENVDIVNKNPGEDMEFEESDVDYGFFEENEKYSNNREYDMYENYYPDFDDYQEPTFIDRLLSCFTI